MAEFSKGIEWDEGDVVTEAKMQKMVANDLFLYQHRIPIKVKPFRRNTHTEGVKIASGSIQFSPSKRHTIRRQISFGNYFSVGCRPVIVVTPGISRGLDASVMTAIHGINANIPDHRGFVVFLSRPSERKASGFGKGTYLNWIAIGW